MPRGPKGERRPADVIGNAVHVMRLATGQSRYISLERLSFSRLFTFSGEPIATRQLDIKAPPRRSFFWEPPSSRRRFRIIGASPCQRRRNTGIAPMNV